MTVAMPRMRDFRGLDPSRSTVAAIIRSAQGADHFPEIDFDKVDADARDGHRGRHQAKTDAEARDCWWRSIFPFRQWAASVQTRKPEAFEWIRRARSRISCAAANGEEVRRAPPRLLDVANERGASDGERFEARLKLAELPRNGRGHPRAHSLRGDWEAVAASTGSPRCAASPCASSAIRAGSQAS